MNTAKFLIVFGLLACVVPAGADIIYDNGAPDNQSAWASDFDDFQETADDFTLGAGANRISDVHWWGVYAFSDTPSADNFTIRIYGNNNGEPNLTAIYELTGLNVTRTLVGAISDGFDLYSYDVDIAPIVLAPNTTYWISILNDTRNDANDDWFWAEHLRTGGNVNFRRFDGGSWLGFDTEMAFYLTGIVPEPASMALMGLGLTILAARMRKQSS